MSDSKLQQPGLFDILKQESRKYASKGQADERRQILTFTPSQIDDWGRALFSNLRRGGFCTFVVSGRHPWNPRSYYYEVARQAATKGRDITRAFLLPHRQYRSESTLREHISMDKDAGVKVEILLVGDLLSKSSIPLLQSLDFGIWDDSIVCSTFRSSSLEYAGPSEWRVSARPEDVQHGRELMQMLLASATRLDLDFHSEEELNLEEPMISTAPIAEFLSTVLCRGNHVAKEDCSWYHSIWQYLRVFNMVSTPTWHSQFYFDSLQAVVATKDRPRILISGTADYSMLAHVLWIFRPTVKPAHVVVLDLCETPLFLCRWYAKSVTAEVETVSADIFAYSPPVPFDCIVTDAFITRFPPEDRAAIVRKWASLLQPVTGRVITTVRIEASTSAAGIRATPSQADSFRQRAVREANKWADFLTVSTSDIGNRSQRYAERMTSYSIASTEELRALFQENGFVVDRIEVADLPGEMSPVVYAEIVARRQDGK